MQRTVSQKSDWADETSVEIRHILMAVQSPAAEAQKTQRENANKPEPSEGERWGRHLYNSKLNLQIEWGGINVHRMWKEESGWHSD